MEFTAAERVQLQPKDSEDGVRCCRKSSAAEKLSYFSTHHFGSTMEDYSFHGDTKRRDNFLRRNHKWKDADIYTPAYASYTLLW